MRCKRPFNNATATAKRNRSLNMIASETLKLTFDVDYRAIRRIRKYYAR